MDPTPLNNLDALPYTGLTAAMMYRLLGPTAKYLGNRTQELTEKSVQNIEKMFNNALSRLPDDAKEQGEVPPRVLRAAINEGAFTEDNIASSYLGGVLASSKTDSNRDDRGVCINALISRLSVFQLRLHYVAYSVLHELLQGTDPDFYHRSITEKNKLHYGTVGLLIAMGFDKDGHNDAAFNMDSALTHALYGLSKEELIADWQFEWKRGFSCSLTPIGIELFLWANGQGRRSIEYFFDPEFTPIDSEGDEENEVLFLPGRECELMLDNGKTVIVDGFDYDTPIPDMLVCRLESDNPPSTGDASS